MKSKFNSRKVLGSIVGIIIYAVFIVIFTYAYYNWKSDNANVVLGIKDLSIQCIAGSPINISNIGPVFDAKDGAKFPFSVKNDMKDEKTISLNLNITSISDNLLVESFRYALVRDTEGGTNYDYGNPVLSGDFTKLKVGNNLLSSSIPVSASSTNSFTFIVYIDGNEYNDPNMQENSLVGSLNIGNCDKVETKGKLLYDVVKMKGAISDKDIDFSELPEDDIPKGVYIRSGTENDTKPVYYYRGNVEDNNIIFADICFKIVRTTETGGIKLIYNGLPTNGQCTATYEESIIGYGRFNGDEGLNSVGYMYGALYKEEYQYDDITYYLYGSDVTYSNGKYNLTGDIQTGINNELGSHHYTCLNTTGTCEEVMYVNLYSISYRYLRYIVLSNGKKVENALDEMLNHNTISSSIKGDKDTEGTIDNWYYTNIEQKGYTKYLEDTVWCNDRSISEMIEWTTDTILTDCNTGTLIYKAFKRNYTDYTPSLNCERRIDCFTRDETNGNGALNYPVGLLTIDENILAGGFAVNDWADGVYQYGYLSNGLNTWTMTPSRFSDFSRLFVSLSEASPFGASLDPSNPSGWNGIRPAISLSKGTIVSEGNGTIESPYTIEYN